jgi:hypothetical protein
VIAADIDPRHVQVPEQVEVRALNVITDDLPVVRCIHARCLLAHLPTRLEVLARMVAACEPGGTITIEEWWQDTAGYVAASAEPNLSAGMAVTSWRCRPRFGVRATIRRGRVGCRRR